MKKFWKIIAYFLLITSLFFTTIVLTSLFYKDEIIKLLTKEVNKNIKTKLEVAGIHLNVLKEFPNISIEFRRIKFYSSLENELLLKSEKLFFMLDIIDLIQRNITINQLKIINAKLYIHVDKQGNKNYNVFTVQKNEKISSQKITIKSIVLKNIELQMEDEVRGTKNKATVEQLLGAILVDNKGISLSTKSNLMIEKTNIGNLQWLQKKHITLNLKYFIQEDKIQFFPSKILVENMDFDLNGFFAFDKTKKIDLKIKSNKLQFSDLKTLMAAKNKQLLKFLKGQGEILITSSIKGNLVNQNWPSFEASFLLKGFELQHSKLSTPLKNINVEGNVRIENIQKLENTRVEIKKFSASIHNKKIYASGNVTNFKTPQIKGNLKGIINFPWALFIMDSKLDSLANGSLGVDLKANIQLNEDFSIKNSHILGNLSFNDVSIFNVYNFPITKIKGTINFLEEKTKLNNLSILFGENDMLINGYLKLPNSKKEEKKTHLNLEIKSKYLHLDKIFDSIVNSQDSTAKKKELPLFSVNLNLEIDHLKFQKFNAKKLKANFTFNKNMFYVNRMTSEGLGGKIALRGSISHPFNEDYYVQAKVKTHHINIDSLFYVFKNFDQSFITADVIKGNLDADIYTKMYFNTNGDFKRNLLYTEASLVVKNGELNNFEPIMSLSTYLNDKEENLAKLKFSNLTNQILIKNDTVYIANMDVGTNVKNIKIGGYHTLDQHIDYRLDFPITKHKLDPDTKFGKVKTNKLDVLYIPIRIKGTTDEYKITYDFKKASSNFAKGIKKELKAVGKMLFGKTKKKIAKDTLSLDEGEFFDWEEDN